MSIPSQGDPRIAEIFDLIFQALREGPPTSRRPPGANEDTELALAGMREVARELVQARITAEATQRRLTEIEEVMLGFVALDYTRRLPIGDSDDVLDGVATGLNILAEELSVSTVSRKYVDNIFESIGDLLFVIDADGTIRSANRAACTTTGRSHDELIGQPLGLVFPDLAVEALPEHLGTSGRELACATRSGGIIAVSFSASSLIDGSSGAGGFVCLARDLTESKRLEEEQWRLRETMQRQAILFEEMSTPLIPISRDVLVMPLIGSLDEGRAQQMTEALLQGIVSRRARVAIVDITGVRTVDTQAVAGLMRAVQSARLVGAEVLLTGLGPAVAQAIVALDVDLDGVVTFGDLERGITHANKYLRGENGDRR